MKIKETLKEQKVGHIIGDRGFSEDRPTLVMIHGAGGSSVVWQNQITFLGEELNLLALDLPGHGDTEDQGFGSIHDYTQWLGHTLQVLFPGPVFLMGHSMGGAIVQDAGLTYPDLLKGIILVGTGPRLRVAPMFLEGLLNNFEQTVDAIIGYAYSRKTDHTIIKEGARLMKSAGPALVYRDFSACNEFDTGQDLDRITLPCLVVCGSEDKLTPLKLSEDLKESISGSVLKIIPDTGHMVMIEGYERFNMILLEFIGGKYKVLEIQ